MGVRARVNNKGVGLLAIWASAFLAMITIFIIFQFVTPIVGQIEYQLQGLIYSGNLPMDDTWRTFYINTSATLQQVFGFFFIALFISLIVFVIVQAARRETYEYEEDRF